MTIKKKQIMAHITKTHITKNVCKPQTKTYRRQQKNKRKPKVSNTYQS